MPCPSPFGLRIDGLLDAHVEDIVVGAGVFRFHCRDGNTRSEKLRDTVDHADSELRRDRDAVRCSVGPESLPFRR